MKTEKTEKKIISRRKFMFATGTVLAGATLAACAAPQAAAPAAAPAAPAAPAAVEAPKATEAPAAAAPAPAPEPTVAVGEYGTGTPTVIWHGLGGADGAVFAQMLADYAKTNNTAVRSEQYGWDVFFQKYPTAVAAGTPPDFAIHHLAEVPQMAAQGINQPLDDVFYAATKIDKADFGKSVMDVAVIDGKAQCVPFDNHGWNCYVNTKLMEGTGFSAENMPKNADDFLKYALKVTVDDAGKHPDETGFNPDKVKVWALHFSWPRFTMPSTWFQYNGGKGGQYDAVSNKSLIDSEKSTAAVQYWHDLMYKHKVVPPALPGQPSSYDLFKTNSLGIMWDGTWSLGFFKDNPEIEKVTKAVTMNSLAPDGTGGQKIDSHIMAIPTGAKPEQVDRAVKLIQWLSDNGKTWATSGQIPARLSVQQDPAVQAIWSVKGASDAFAKQGYTETPHKAFIELQTAWETGVSAALSNTAPVKEALGSAAKVIQSVLDRG